MIRKFFFPLLILVLSSCSTKHGTEMSTHIPFINWEGVTLTDSIGIYKYKDTLYYYNEPSDFIFKIPPVFTAHKGSNWDLDGVHLVNEDGSMRIDLTAIDRGITPYSGETITHEDILSNIACDNGDVRMAYELHDNGYFKAGFTEDFKPLLEKAYAIFDDADGLINAHIHIVRFTYPDSLAKVAYNLNQEYIKPWPNNIYK